MRSVDADGHLRVEECRISKANICPYYGREIPRAAQLGLEPDRLYRLFRDPVELEKGADTFTGKPLLIKHVAISADLPSKELWVGTLGTVTFEAPYLVSRPLMVWTSEAIRLIETEEQRELSSAYRYDAEMVPGIYGGESYDGRMVNIRANHCAIVSEGRAGPDVHVADELPLELKIMAKLKHAARIEALKPYLAKDLDDKALLALDEKMDKDDEEAEDRAHDCYGKDAAEWEKMSAADKKKARDEWKDDEDKKAKDKAAKDKAAKDKAAKDKAAKDAEVDHRNDFDPGKDSVTKDELSAAVKAGVDAAVKRTNTLHEARKAVEPIVGVVAFDSADEVYAFALKHVGIDTKDVPPAAFPALLSVFKAGSKPTPIAMDRAAVRGNDVDAIWPISAAIRRRA